MYADRFALIVDGELPLLALRGQTHRLRETAGNSSRRWQPRDGTQQDDKGQKDRSQ